MSAQQEQNPLSKLAIISMTAVATSDRRIARALQAKEAYQSQFPAIGSGEMTWAINSYFQTLHDPTLLYLDEMLPGAKSHLAQLSQHGYQIVLVSPLPESSREPLRAWFADQGIPIAAPALAVLGLDGIPIAFGQEPTLRAASYYQQPIYLVFPAEKAHYQQLRPKNTAINEHYQQVLSFVRRATCRSLCICIAICQIEGSRTIPQNPYNLNIVFWSKCYGNPWTGWRCAVGRCVAISTTGIATFTSGTWSLRPGSSRCW